MSKTEQLKNLVSTKIKILESIEKRGDTSKSLEKEIELLAGIYFDLTANIDLQFLSNLKTTMDQVDFIINKEFNMPKAVKKYAEQLITDLKADTNV